MYKFITSEKSNAWKSIVYMCIFLLLTCSVSVLAQGIAISGTVIERGEPLPGATVRVMGTNIGTTTDVNGSFQINVPNAEAILQFSFVGFTTVEMTVGSQREINVDMSDASHEFDELVVIGYGMQRKALLTGATLNVSGEDIQRMSTTNPFTALQNQTPGVNILRSSGQPGSGYIVNIRGMGTSGESRPLYVIDGVAVGHDGLNHLNVADIESIDILKDAASAAIFGARAANGVILITTRQGRPGQLRLSYDVFFGRQYMYRKPEMMNARQYIEFQNRIWTNLNLPNNATDDWWRGNLPDGLFNDIMSGAWDGFDWIDAWYNRGAATVNHALNLTGGNDISTFSMGYSYSSQDGIFGVGEIQSNYTRHTFRLNSNHVVFRAGNRDIITIGNTLNYMFRLSNAFPQTGRHTNSLRDVMIANPLLTAYNEDGDFNTHAEWTAAGWRVDGQADNPLGRWANSSGALNERKDYNFNASVNIQIQPISGLIFRTQGSYRQNAMSSRSLTNRGRWSGRTANDHDIVTQDQSIGFNWAIINTLTYNFRINDHTFTALLGQEASQSGFGEQVGAGGRHLNFPFGFDFAWVNNLDPATQIADITRRHGRPNDRSSLVGFFGRVEWNLRETYMANVILRADGSSNFARGNRMGYFPSVSAGWILSNESFLADVSAISFLRLRASWGQNGNHAIEGFQYLTTFTFPAAARYFFGADKMTPHQGAIPGVLKNPHISWERSEQTNIGVDARFMRNRLGVVFDWFIKDTKDWLLRAPLAGTWGFQNPHVNGGATRNTGVELALTWNDRRGDFRYGVNLNGSILRNRVTAIDNPEGIIHGPRNAFSETTPDMYRLQVGEPMGFWYGWVHDGIFQNQREIEEHVWLNPETGIYQMIQPTARPGDIRFLDLDNDGQITEDDRKNIGNGWPRAGIGFSFNLQYRGWDFMVAGNGSFGHQIMKTYNSFADRRWENRTVDWLTNPWTHEGSTNFYPRFDVINHRNYTNISRLWMESGNHVRIQNITLGYDFTRLLPALPFNRARFYVTAQNPFIITNYSGMDPEVGHRPENWVTGMDLGFHPPARTFLAGFQVTF